MERNEMRWDIQSPDTEDPLYANLIWSILQEEERKEVNWDEKRKQMTDKKELVRTHIWQEVVLFRDLKKIVLENYCFFSLVFFACYETSQKQVPARPIK